MLAEFKIVGILYNKNPIKVFDNGFSKVEFTIGIKSEKKDKNGIFIPQFYHLTAENYNAIVLNDIKKGDTVIVSGKLNQDNNQIILFANSISHMGSSPERHWLFSYEFEKGLRVE